MTKPVILGYEAFISYALDHYYKGGDAYYECWDRKVFDEYVKQFGVITKKKALRMFRDEYSHEQEMKAMSRW